MKTAIITGASSGLGVELLRAVAALCPEIEEFWLLARREDRLAAAAAQVEGKKTFLLPIDLTDYGRYDALRSALEEKQPDVVWLFNNAGFGKLGDYGEIDPRDHYDIANLNCAALSAVTGTVLPYMHAGAHIVNVCSIAAFAPALYDRGLSATIGKGNRSAAVVEAIRRNRAVYLVAIGGAGAIAARHIASLEEIAFPELGCESVKRLVFSDFPLIVGIDCAGGNIYERGKD